MKTQVQCFSIKIVPYSVNPESHVITLPAPERGFLDDEEGAEDSDEQEQKNAYEFLRMVLKDFLPPNLELEEASSIYGDNEGFFFSCSDSDSDTHYYLLLKYAIC